MKNILIKPNKENLTKFVTIGGRVRAVVARGSYRECARVAAYGEAAKVAFDGAQQRSDIGSMHFD